MVLLNGESRMNRSAFLPPHLWGRTEVGGRTPIQLPPILAFPHRGGRNRSAYLLLAVLFFLLSIPQLFAAEQLETAGAPYAPLDPSKVKSTLTQEDRDDAVKEFKGLMSMALSKVPENRWAGRSMADCERASQKGSWCSRCEIIMPHANGFYFFYPEGGSCTLQQFEAHVHTDGSVMSQMRAPLQSYFGRGESLESGMRRRWITEGDKAELFLDRTRGEPFVHFLWSRDPRRDN